jgi:hypothetical protein
MCQVLEAVPTEVADRDPVWQVVLDKGPGGLGEQHLAPVSGGGDPGGPVHVDPQVVVPSQASLPGKHAHADPEGPAVEPGMGGQGSLGGHRGPNGPWGRGEHSEEGIPLGPELGSFPLGDGRPHEAHVIVLHRPVVLTKLLEELGGALDVGEQERDGACGEVGHSSSRA